MTAAEIINDIKLLPREEQSRVVEFASGLPRGRQVEEKFNELATQWYKDTRKLSSVQQIVLHPAYQKIIGMGKEALPLIFRELQTTRSHWLWALAMIVGEDHATPGQTFKEAVDSWIRWGQESGYL